MGYKRIRCWPTAYDWRVRAVSTYDLAGQFSELLLVLFPLGTPFKGTYVAL
jgi:hypothetical protein